MLVENKIEIGGYVPNQLEEIGTFLNMGFATPTTMFVHLLNESTEIANCSSSPWLHPSPSGLSRFGPGYQYAASGFL